MRSQRRFDLHRVDVESAADDHVLEPVNDVQVAPGVDIAKVAGLPGAIFELRSGGFRVAVVAFDDGLTADADLASFTDGQWFAVLGGDKHFDPRCSAAGRGEVVQGGSIAGLVRGLVEYRDEHRRFGGRIALDEYLPKALDQLTELGRAHGGRAINQRGQGGEVLGICALQFQQAIQDGRHQE
ncbi:hypothetical protein D3C78_1221580 [compost metagenome]